MSPATLFNFNCIYYVSLVLQIRFDYRSYLCSHLYSYPSRAIILQVVDNSQKVQNILEDFPVRLHLLGFVASAF